MGLAMALRLLLSDIFLPRSWLALSSILAKCCGAQLLATGPPTVNWLCQISMVCFHVKDRLFTQSPFEVAASIFIRFLWALYGTDVWNESIASRKYSALQARFKLFGTKCWRLQNVILCLLSAVCCLLLNPSVSVFCICSFLETQIVQSTTFQRIPLKIILQKCSKWFFIQRQS